MMEMGVALLKQSMQAASILLCKRQVQIKEVLVALLKQIMQAAVFCLCALHIQRLIILENMENSLFLWHVLSFCLENASMGTIQLGFGFQAKTAHCKCKQCGYTEHAGVFTEHKA